MSCCFRQRFALGLLGLCLLVLVLGLSACLRPVAEEQPAVEQTSASAGSYPLTPINPDYDPYGIPTPDDGREHVEQDATPQNQPLSYANEVLQAEGGAGPQLQSNIVQRNGQTYIVFADGSTDTSYVIGVDDAERAAPRILHRQHSDGFLSLSLLEFNDQLHLVQAQVDAAGRLSCEVYLFGDDGNKGQRLALLLSPSVVKIEADSAYSRFKFFDSEGSIIYGYLRAVHLSERHEYIEQTIIIAINMNSHVINVYQPFEPSAVHGYLPIAMHQGELYYLCESLNIRTFQTSYRLSKQRLSKQPETEVITDFSSDLFYYDEYSARSGNGFLLVEGSEGGNYNIVLFDMVTDSASYLLETETLLENYNVPVPTIHGQQVVYTDTKAVYEAPPPVDLSVEEDKAWMLGGRNSLMAFSLADGSVTTLRDAPAEVTMNPYQVTADYFYCWMIQPAYNVYRVRWTDPQRSFEVLKLADLLGAEEGDEPWAEETEDDSQSSPSPNDSSSTGGSSPKVIVPDDSSQQLPQGRKPTREPPIVC
ncbi:MAG: hypothetical protein LBR39_08680 [Coriobacteriales bacterium]|nr:hypothetical protein [Coriobacteriales bacterium]